MEMAHPARPLCVLGPFEPFGLTAEGLPPSACRVADCLADDEFRIKGRHHQEPHDFKYPDGKCRYYLFDPAVTRGPDTGLEHLVVSSSCEDHDEELFIHGNTIVWSSGCQVRKRFSASTAVIQTIWCRFDSMPDPLLCVLHSDSLSTYTPSGEMNSVPLPYVVASIWPLPYGLLLQRAFDVSIFAGPGPVHSTNMSLPANREWFREGFREVAAFSTGHRHSPSPFNFNSSNRRSSYSSQHFSRPVFSHFTLQHPLEEPQALQFEEAGKVRPMLDVEEQMIWTSSAVPYVVSYHNVRMQHSLWQIKILQSKQDSNFTSGATSWTQSHALEDYSQICLQRVWQDKGIQPLASKVFMATDDDGVSILCLLLKDSKRLIAFRLPHHGLSEDIALCLKLDVAWNIPATASVPTVATWSRLRQAGKQRYDILVLAPDGSLFLHTGRHRLCQLYLQLNDLGGTKLSSSLGCTPEPMQTEGHSEELDDKMQIVGICDSVQGRFNVITSSGQAYRCAVQSPPFSALTALCINALYESLQPPFWHHFLVALWQHEFSRAQDVGLLNLGADGKPDWEWASFSDLLLKWSGKMDGNEGKQMMESMPAWEFLLNSTMHRKNLKCSSYVGLSLPAAPEHANKSLQLDATKYVSEESMDPSSMLMEIIEALHAVYEDCKLDSLRWGELQPLAALLSSMGSSLGLWNYADHYARDFPGSAPLLQNIHTKSPTNLLKSPPNLFGWLESCVRERQSVRSGKGLPELLFKEDTVAVDWSRKVVAFYDLLCGSEVAGKLLPSGVHVSIAGGSVYNSEQRVVLAMVAEGFGLPELDRLPPGVSLPLRHALNRCREAPSPDWPESAFVLVGREDLASMQANRVNSLAMSGSGKVVNASMILMAAPYMLHLRPVPIISSSGDLNEVIDLEIASGEEIVSDGMEHIFNTTAQLRFGRDLRLNEVRRLLCSSRPVAVRMANPPDVSDPDIVAQQQAQLWQLAQRTTSLSFGRGAFTLAISRALLTEALPIPKLVLAGRLPSQHDATVNLDATTGNLADLTSWPEFHNGVAAGLRLAPCQAKISRTWIVYNKPVEPSYAHAGLLMALGLHRHLKVLAATDVYRYLSQEHEATTVGILLGMAAAYRGSMDPAISKMLYLHIPARHPPSFPELELPTLMQSAALMAVGMLYQGSAHRLTTEILLAEIGRRPGGDNILEREGYALAAGLALGLVTLGRGKDAWGLADLMIEERLRLYMSGGRELADERNHRFDGAFSNLLSSASRNLEDVYQNNGQVMEGSMFNLDVTAPGATLALALMFLKTNSQEVAARLSIPDTHFALEYVRPDFILLRVVARSLILWDSIHANEDWIQVQIPVVVKEAVAATKDGMAALETSLADTDMEALAQAHVNILAGSCLAIGLKYAGTSNADAQQLLHRYALYFLKEKRSAAPLSGTVGPNGRRTYVDCGTLETCLNVAILSLSVVMAGSGHLNTFRLLRYLRRRNDTDGIISYGNHMAISMAMGFLFLGGGTLTFATNNNAVAALLISLYPRFPTSPNDHRCHLQAFRHLYVLATEARCVQTVDVDTGMPVYVPLEITLKETHSYSETTFCQVTPCILPELSMLKRVRVCGPRYWPQDIEFESGLLWWVPWENGDAFNNGVIYVKRKVGARSYIDDPIGCRSLLSRTIHRVCGKDKTRSIIGEGEAQGHSKVDQIVSTFSADPSMLAFAQLCCSSSQDNGPGCHFEEFCSQALLECVSTDRPALLQVYLSLYTTVEALVDRATGHGGTYSSFCNESLSLCGLKVALVHSEVLSSGDTQLQGPLVQRTFLAALSKRVDDVFNLIGYTNDQQITESSFFPDLINYLNQGKMPYQANMLKHIQGLSLFTCYLHWYNIPYPAFFRESIKGLSFCFPGALSTNMWSFSNLPMLALLLPGIPTAALVQVNQCLSFLDIMHKYE